MQPTEDEVFCQPSPATRCDIVALDESPDMLVDKAPRVSAPCLICYSDTSEESCAIILRGYPTDASDSADAVGLTAACLKHADALADMLGKPHVNDNVKQFAIFADLDRIDTRCIVCQEAFDDKHGVIGLGHVRLHVGCATSFVKTIRGIEQHADKLLGHSL